MRDCFVRAFDDALVIKGLKFRTDSFDDRPVRNVRFSRCVVWCDWGRAMEIGAETCAPEIADMAFRDCDIVRTTHIAMDIQHGDRAASGTSASRTSGWRSTTASPRPACSQPEEKYPKDPKDRYCPTLMEIVIRKNVYSQDEQRGSVRDVVFKDIAVTSRHAPLVVPRVRCRARGGRRDDANLGSTANPSSTPKRRNWTSDPTSVALQFSKTGP